MPQYQGSRSGYVFENRAHNAEHMHYAYTYKHKGDRHMDRQMDRQGERQNADQAQMHNPFKNHEMGNM